MFSGKLMGGSIATFVAAGVVSLAAATAQAGALPGSPGAYSMPDVQLAWCAVALTLGLWSPALAVPANIVTAGIIAGDIWSATNAL